MSHRIFNNFIDSQETEQIITWVSDLGFKKGQPNRHLHELSKSLNGGNTVFDISQTEETGYISQFQAISPVVTSGVPDFIHAIIKRIGSTLNIPTTRSFMQAVDMQTGGSIQKHYDAAVDGFINYKCNISVLSAPYDFCIGEDTINIKQSDLYCFEASLYKHWTPTPFTTRRILLSFGFLLPYEIMGRDENDVRVRLSKRIEKYFQNSLD
jgi:hypothetical protein